MKKVIPKKPESKYVSALPKILNGPSLLTCRSATSSIIFGPFRLLGLSLIHISEPTRPY